MPTARRRTPENTPNSEPAETTPDTQLDTGQPDAESSTAASEPSRRLRTALDVALERPIPTRPEPLPNVHQCIAKAMRLVRPVGKEGVNQSDGYRFKRIDDFMTAANAAMAEAGVHAVPKVLKRITDDTSHTTQRGNVIRWVDLQVRFRFYGPAGDYVDAITWGEGRDASDKATNKALTAAQKYALMYVLMIPTSDIADGDADSPESQRQQPPPQPPQRTEEDERVAAMILRDDAPPDAVRSFRHDALVVADRHPVGQERRAALELIWRMAGNAGALGCEVTLPAPWQAIAGMPVCTLHQLLVGAQSIAVKSGETDDPAPTGAVDKVVDPEDPWATPAPTGETK
jgi:hypothetical protein